MKRLFFLLTVWVCSSAYAATAGSGIADPSYFGVGARAVGMGRAIVANPYGSEAIFSNPAGLGSAQQWNSLLSYAALISDVKFLQAATSFATSTNAFGIGVLDASIGGLDYTTSSSVVQGTFDYSSTILFGTYAFPMSSLFNILPLPDNAHAGVTIKYFAQGFSNLIQNGKGTGVDMDLGLQFVPEKSTNVGVFLKNILPTNIVFPNSVEPIPAMATVGLSTAFLQDTLLGNFAMVRELDRNRPLTLHVGTEWWVVPNLNLRAGMDQEPIAPELSDGAESVYTNLSLGLGFTYHEFGLDFAYRIQRFALSDDQTYFATIKFLPDPDALAYSNAENVLVKLEREARAGNAEKSFTLGKMYLNGDQVEKDTVVAARWILMAAEQGHAEAAYKIATMLETGQGTPKNDKDAFNWYKMAAEHSLLGAQMKVADMYGKGKGVYKNVSKSLDWYLKAAATGHESSQLQVASMYANGDGTKQNIAESLNWYKRAAVEHNNAEAQFQLGEFYMNDDAVKQDRGEAERWYRKAAEQNHTMAAARLKDLGGLVNKTVAVMPVTPPPTAGGFGELLQQAQAGNPEAAFKVAGLLLAGIGGAAPDLVGAESWYQKAAEAGNTQAQTALGKAYYNGDPFKLNYREAKKWLPLAANKGSAEAQYYLGQMYVYGLGFAPDPVQGYMWTALSAAQNYADAVKDLDSIRGFMSQAQIDQADPLIKSFKPK